ncbi:MAG: zf-TFIIB domain-containing protein [Polaromonas sp.]|nr:zf-TFIIB domain-containing protein [Polaromonas sp.]
MKCPTCPESTLVMSDRQGIEIDYCPQCRGVWLDRGELDKLIERAAVQPGAPVQAAQPAQPVHARQPVQHRQPDFVDSDYRSHGGHGGQGGYGYGKRKKSWISEIFD